MPAFHANPYHLYKTPLLRIRGQVLVHTRDGSTQEPLGTQRRKKPRQSPLHEKFKVFAAQMNTISVQQTYVCEVTRMLLAITEPE